MSIGHALPEAGPRHGYDRERTCGDQFGRHRPLHYGQACSTLSRRLKNGLAGIAGAGAVRGPDRTPSSRS
ncbi:hypothetical protein AB0K15_09335 [Amycolatopsis sp. NPDC049253]|uniref:hypothetical protein n=1 Tax=Amycolatopsis sp. NPDC049253 TaxID=3155274 RepID=UPI0034278DBE